jgi:hypothetical protein
MRRKSNPNFTTAHLLGGRPAASGQGPATSSKQPATWSVCPGGDWLA